MNNVLEALAEIKQAYDDMQLEHEGLRDYAAMNLKAETKAIVVAAIGMYDRRTELMRAAHQALTALVDDGYPVLEIPGVTTEVLEDLKFNRESVAAAFDQFKPQVAEDLGLATAPPEQK